MENVYPVEPVRGAYRSYAQPLAGLRISWGSVLAGAVAALASTLLMFMLALAIILTAAHGNMGSLRNSLIAAFICGIVLTIVGAFIGGLFAGYLPGNVRRVIAGTHGFLSWALSFLLVAGLEFGMLGGALRTTALMTAQTANVAAQTAVGARGGPATLDQGAVNTLQALGVPPAEARSTVDQFRISTQRSFAAVTPGELRGRVRGAMDTLVDYSAGLSWAFFGTWLLSAIAAVLGGLAAVPRLRRRDFEGRVIEEKEAVVPPRAYVQTPEPA